MGKLSHSMYRSRFPRPTLKKLMSFWFSGQAELCLLLVLLVLRVELKDWADVSDL